jgi:hypothetical protein
MSIVVSDARAREASIELVIIRADGSRENVGVVSYWHRNPFKRFAWRVRNFFNGRSRPK